MEDDEVQITVVREVGSLLDEFELEYYGVGVQTAAGDVVSGVVRFPENSMTQNISIPTHRATVKSAFQLKLTEVTSPNSNAIGDITINTHLGMFVDSDCNTDIPTTTGQTPSTDRTPHSTDPSCCSGHPMSRPKHPVTLSIPWNATFPEVIKYNGLCYV